MPGAKGGLGFQRMSERRVAGPHLRRLKALGQLLKPVVHLGKGGMSEALLATLDRALADHELIKVKIDQGKEQKESLAAEMAARTGSALIQKVGHVVVLYRPHPDPTRRKVSLPSVAGDPEGAGPGAWGGGPGQRAAKVRGGAR